jgi:hypothetical protein
LYRNIALCICNTFDVVLIHGDKIIRKLATKYRENISCLKVINILPWIHRKETTEFVNLTEVSVSPYHQWKSIVLLGSVVVVDWVVAVVVPRMKEKQMRFSIKWLNRKRMSYYDVLFTYYTLNTCVWGIWGNICCQLIVDEEA